MDKRWSVISFDSHFLSEDFVMSLTRPSFSDIGHEEYVRYHVLLISSYVIIGGLGTDLSDA